MTRYCPYAESRNRTVEFGRANVTDRALLVLVLVLKHPFLMLVLRSFVPASTHWWAVAM